MGFGKKPSAPAAAPQPTATPVASTRNVEGPQPLRTLAQRETTPPAGASLLDAGEGAGDVDPLTQKRRLSPVGGASLIG